MVKSSVFSLFWLHYLELFKRFSFLDFKQVREHFSAQDSRHEPMNKYLEHLLNTKHIFWNGIFLFQLQGFPPEKHMQMVSQVHKGLMMAVTQAIFS